MEAGIVSGGIEHLVVSGPLLLAVPVALAQLAAMGMGFVDLVGVGRVSVEAFAAVALANPWHYATLFFAQGLLMALDPVVSQAHGARDGPRAAIAFQQG
ncbi:MATE family efflux transporter, partial [Klebsiella pneumoniae]|uniref:MATE family efflux transporter n=1 Tax=Klebsiella pneumoniae TaxID=573 RepID=UPI003A855E06